MMGTADRTQEMMRYDANKKSLIVAYLLWFFLGWFGLHRFYLGKIFSGVVLLLLWLACASLTLLTLGIGYISFLIPALWLFVDAFLIPVIVRRYNNELIDTISSRDETGH
jgi:TM2 domain-containing membrane protein YozV